MAHVARLTTYPVKSLDPHDRERVGVVAGAFDGDREYAIVDADGDRVNGKRTAAVHGIASAFDPETHRLTLCEQDTDDASEFDLDAERVAAERWLSDFFGYRVELVRDDSGGFPDDTQASGPTVVSTATLREVTSWFSDIDETGMRRRLRANVEVGGVPPFWEDRLFAGEHTGFAVGDVRFEAENPCRRCVVPTRAPLTGVADEGFVRRFVERREASLPEWTDPECFEGFFRVMVNTRVPRTEWGTTLSVGDTVRPEVDDNREERIE